MNVVSLSDFLERTEGLRITEKNKGTYLEFTPNFRVDKLPELLQVLRQNNMAFELYDELYPSPSDPCAYISYSQEKNADDSNWGMTLGNHGWSGGIYQISDSVIEKQLTNLIQLKMLKGIQIGKVVFFSHYKLEEKMKSKMIEERLISIHLNKPGL